MYVRELCPLSTTAIASIIRAAVVTHQRASGFDLVAFLMVWGRVIRASLEAPATPSSAPPKLHLIQLWLYRAQGRLECTGERFTEDRLCTALGKLLIYVGVRLFSDAAVLESSM